MIVIRTVFITHRDRPESPLLSENRSSHLNGAISCVEGAPYVTNANMTNTLIGYARCSTDKQALPLRRTPCESSASLRIAFTQITASRARSAPDRDWTRRARPFAEAIRLSCPSLTGPLALSPMPEPLATNFPHAASDYRSGAASMIHPTRWASCSSISSRPSPSSQQT